MNTQHQTDIFKQQISEMPIICDLFSRFACKRRHTLKRNQINDHQKSVLSYKYERIDGRYKPQTELI